MPTSTRPELSGKNKHWIEKHRYYELVHFCRQYPMWKQAYAELDSEGMSKYPIGRLIVTVNGHADPTANIAESKAYYSERMDLLTRVAKETDLGLWDYILKGVTEGMTYSHLKSRLDIPCSKDVYYKLYRKFFWLLNRARE